MTDLDVHRNTLVRHLHSGHISCSRAKASRNDASSHHIVLVQLRHNLDVKRTLECLPNVVLEHPIRTPGVSHGLEIIPVRHFNVNPRNVAGSSDVLDQNAHPEEARSSVHFEGDVLAFVFAGDSFVKEIEQASPAQLVCFARKSQCVDCSSAEIKRWFPRAAICSSGAEVCHYHRGAVVVA